MQSFMPAQMKTANGKAQTSQGEAEEEGGVRGGKGKAARSAGMFVHKGACQCTSSPPAWLWENMSAEARETWLAWRMRNICVRLALPTGIKFAHMHKGKNALKC